MKILKNIAVAIMVISSQSIFAMGTGTKTLEQYKAEDLARRYQAKTEKLERTQAIQNNKRAATLNGVITSPNDRDMLLDSSDSESKFGPDILSSIKVYLNILDQLNMLQNDNQAALESLIETMNNDSSGEPKISDSLYNQLQEYPTLHQEMMHPAVTRVIKHIIKNDNLGK